MSEEIKSYPLCWPSGWKRSASHRRAKFSSLGRNSEGRRGWPTQLTVAQALKRVIDELGRMGVPDWNVIVSTNIATRRDGLPYSNQAEPKDSGAAVYWKDRKDARKCIAIDHYDRVADNLAAIAATLDAMRAIERHGGAEILQRVFMGFTALPAPDDSWWRVFQFDNREQALRLGTPALEARFRELAKLHHPDAGGSADAFQKLVDAKEQALAELLGNIQ